MVAKLQDPNDYTEYFKQCEVEEEELKESLSDTQLAAKVKPKSDLPKTYYFVVYKRYNRFTTNKVMDRDPIDWITEVWENHSHFVLINYHKITKEQYDRLKRLGF